jgi:predicted translin family RNA/ssDNA-binding protein
MANPTLNLNVFDEHGVLTGEIQEVSLSVEAIQDIIDHAASLAIRFRNAADTSDIAHGIQEMSEALEVYDIIKESADNPEP